MARYMTYEASKNKTTRGFETDIKDFLKKILLKKEDAEKQVLENMGRIELVQFLGLKDKNDKLIHFGDILIDNENNLLTPVCEIENGEHILFFKPIQHLDKKFGIGCKSTFSNTLEVLGNIYTNSELFTGLKEKGRLDTMIFYVKRSSNSLTTIHIELKKVIISNPGLAI